MKVSFLLRLAAVVALLQFAGHALLFITAVPHTGPAETGLVAAMKTQVFHLGGFRPHSYWDSYFGYGLLAAFAVLIEAALYGLSAYFSKTNPVVVRPLTAVLIFARIGHILLVWIYFSLFLPLVFDLIILLLLSLVLLTKKNINHTQHHDGHRTSV